MPSNLAQEGPLKGESADQNPQSFGPSSSLHAAQLSYRSSALLQKDSADSVLYATLNGCVPERSVIDLLSCSEPTRRYIVDRKIGEGGMGCVYRAVDRDLAREVALKVLEHGEGDARSRFASEAQITGQLEHPNIVPIHEFGVNGDGRLFFTLKLIRGKSLRQVINELREKNPETLKLWPQAKLLRAFISVCNAIAFCHHHRVLHRDLKPSNILLGSFGEVLVTDWGCAKYIGPQFAVAGESQPSQTCDDPEKTSVHLNHLDEDATLDGLLVGTPLYMSPEQACGESTQIDERSDIYSLGATLYEIVTLEHAIPGTRINEVLTNVRRGAIDPPHLILLC